MTFKDLEIKVIIKELRKAFIPENKSFNAFQYNEIKYALLSHLQSSKNISETGHEELIESFLRRFHQEEISEENFLKFFDEAKIKYFRRKEINYSLLTTLSIDYLPFRKIKINDSIIKIIGGKFSEKFAKSRKEVLKKSYKQENDNNFIKILVELKGKSFYDAFEQAYSDLNVFRSILCLNLNSDSEIPLFGDGHRAINKVQFGEFHTLHISETGDSVEEKVHWFEPNYGIKATTFPMEKKEYFKKVLDSWFNNLNKCQREHKNKLSQVLNLYVTAFDERDKQTCFLKSWVALENLLGTHLNDIIVKRCLSIFKARDRDFQKVILTGLKIQRNRIVHENDSRINSIVNCYHVQRYIRSILLYNNLKYWNVIKNNEEAIKLLDFRLLSPDLLKSNIKVLTEVSKIKTHEN